MKKKAYIYPMTEVVHLQLSYEVMLDDLFGQFSEEKEPNTSSWGGAKENGGLFDEIPFGSLWDDDPVEDPFQLDEY